MRKLKTKQQHNCDLCREQGVKRKAAWRNHGFSKCACEEHRQELKAREDEAQRMSDHQSEADFQLGL